MMAAKKFGMGGHQGTMGKDEWLTPKHVIDALGHFDLDPCAPVERPWPTAGKHYTKEDDGLSMPWEGRVWLNPPYGPHTGDWLERLAAHGWGTALVFARTDTNVWHDHVWPKASSVLFLKGRLAFCDTKGVGKKGSGAPSALVSYGTMDSAVLQTCGLPGAWVPFHHRAPSHNLYTEWMTAWGRDVCRS